MTRYIDADNEKLRSELFTYTRYTSIDEAPFEDALKALDDAPTIDTICGISIDDAVLILTKYLNGEMVEVVRCKDCRWWQDNNNGYPHANCHWCETETPDEDDFCSLGERKTK